VVVISDGKTYEDVAECRDIRPKHAKCDKDVTPEMTTWECIFRRGISGEAEAEHCEVVSVLLSDCFSIVES